MLFDTEELSQQERDGESRPFKERCKMQNRTIFPTDMPDIDVIRVEDTYYMVSTTMFFMPGAPILVSKDLCHWELASYIFEQIADNETYRLENGKHAYGKGQWATSLCYYNNKFYACFVCHDIAKTFIYSTENPYKSGWDMIASMDEVFHDMSFLIWDQRVFLVYDNGDIKIVELKDDLSGVKDNGLRKLLFKAPSENIMLRAEGCRAIVKDNMIYLLFIDWPKNGIRRELCYRSKSIDEPFEYKRVFENALGRDGCGVAQGTLVNDKDGKWYAVLFQDRGGSGRIPFIFNVTWVDGWPVIANEPICVDSENGFEAGLFNNSLVDRNGQLAKAWQWNHNPIKESYLLDAKTGVLRLTTGHIADSLLNARNTLTHRTGEPGCAFVAKMDCAHIKVGDYAGLCAFQGKYGQIGIFMEESGPKLYLKMKKNASNDIGDITVYSSDDFDECEEDIAVDKLSGIYFKIVYDFGPDSDIASFYYSFDGDNWIQLGHTLKMVFSIDLFVGYRTGIFYYATKETGGYIDVLSTEFSVNK